MAILSCGRVVRVNVLLAVNAASFPFMTITQLGCLEASMYDRGSTEEEIEKIVCLKGLDKLF